VDGIGGSPDSWYYYPYDGLGSVVALSDSDGNIVESYCCTVFEKADLDAAYLPAGHTRGKPIYINTRSSIKV